MVVHTYDQYHIVPSLSVTSAFCLLFYHVFRNDTTIRSILLSCTAPAVPAKFLHFSFWKILTSVPRGAIIMRSKKYRYGLVAQLGAHHIRIVGVVGSNPIRSTEKTPFPLRDGVFYMERVPPPVVFNILAFTCVNLHLRANAHLRHVIFFDYQEVPV